MIGPPPRTADKLKTAVWQKFAVAIEAAGTFGEEDRAAFEQLVDAYAAFHRAQALADAEAMSGQITALMARFGLHLEGRGVTPLDVSLDDLLDLDVLRPIGDGSRKGA